MWDFAYHQDSAATDIISSVMSHHGYSTLCDNVACCLTRWVIICMTVGHTIELCWKYPT